MPKLLLIIICFLISILLVSLVLKQIFKDAIAFIKAKIYKYGKFQQMEKLNYVSTGNKVIAWVPIIGFIYVIYASVTNKILPRKFMPFEDFFILLLNGVFHGRCIFILIHYLITGHLF